MNPALPNTRRSITRPLAWLLAWVILGLLIGGTGIKTAEAGSRAKKAYLSADTCLKKLKHSQVHQQKVSAWLNCIEKYESIYRVHPKDSWAPAGMFKAAELYFQLYRQSNRSTYRNQALDLTIRIKKKYPKSAYKGRAAILAKAITELSRADSESIQTLKSRKNKTKDTAAIARYKRQLRQAASQETGKTPLETPKADPPVSMSTPETPEPLPPLPNGDARVTNLRFWSNPEYTRIVVNADGERPYTHRLLKKDPKLNVTLQRLYVDIEKSRLGKGVAEHTPINDNLLKQARAGQYQTHTVRVVVDIKAFENYKIFSLKDPFRIVIDVWGKNGKAAPMDELQTALTKTGSGTQAPMSTTTDRVTTDNLKSSDIARQLALGVRKIVIDPGHGGKDPGAPGYIKGVWEKDIVLTLSKNLADELKKRLNCEVLLTRTTDEKLTLEERTAIANTERADLFISMHCNAARNKKLSGIETYILNLATDDQAIAVAARENATSEKNISDLEYILSDLMKHAKIEESTRLANDVHKSMVDGMKKKYPRINDLGVKQAPFYVLLGARMPSILIESSFISNKVECNRLMTQSYRDAICDTIADGVEKYINATNPKHL